MRQITRKIAVPEDRVASNAHAAGTICAEPAAFGNAVGDPV
jgi:hypothetical protein